MKNITYIFSQNRKINYNKNNSYAKDFYYGLHNFDNNKDNEIEIIEYSEKKSFLYPFLLVFDKVMNKFLSLPFYSSKLTNSENLKKFLKADYLFLVNEGVGFSSIFLLLVAKIFKRVKVSIFVMGLYSKKVRFERFTFVHLFIIKLLVLSADNIFFLGKSEHEKAINTHKKYTEKFKFLPFCIDTEFWNPSLGKDKLKNNILFIGNDGMRDYDFAIELAKNMENYNFTFITNKIEKSNLKSNNIELINGFWSEETLSDIEIKNIYENSLLTIIPIVETLQPSGQSVALQSMSLGVPVIITKTNGFWEPKKFIDKENIIFVEKNNITQWKNKINHILSDKEFYEKLSKSAKKTVNENNNLNLFNKNLIKILLN